MNARKTLLIGFATVAVMVAASGCAAPRTASIPPSDAVGIMVRRPDAEDARKCAPAWVEQALLLLNEQAARIKELEIVRPKE